jgi:hypothetical protein
METTIIIGVLSAAVGILILYFIVRAGINKGIDKFYKTVLGGTLYGIRGKMDEVNARIIEINNTQIKIDNTLKTLKEKEAVGQNEIDTSDPGPSDNVVI